MKITKSQLKQIIKEELENVLLEKHDCAKDHPDMSHDAYIREQQQMMLEETGQIAEAEGIREMFPTCFG